MKKIFFISTILLVFALTSISFAQAQVESGKWSVSTSSKGYTKPDIIIGVTMLDANTKTNIRYNVSHMSVSRDGFTIKVSTWSESRISGIGGFWIAHAKEKAE
jgi:hypothetical protein